MHHHPLVWLDVCVYLTHHCFCFLKNQSQVVLFNNQFILIAGRTGQTESSTSDLFLNDVWRANVSTPTIWIKVSPDPTFPPRSDHSVVIEQATAQNENHARLFVIGGENQQGPLSDVWAWAIDPGSLWLQDYTPNALYSAGAGAGYVFEPDGPLQYYFDIHTPVETLIKHLLPKYRTDDNHGVTKPYLTNAQVRSIRHLTLIILCKNKTHKTEQTSFLLM